MVNKQQSCKICGEGTNKIFDAKVIEKYVVDYFKCTNCGFIQTENPYWLEEAYVNSINYSDTGILLRNSRLSKITASIILIFFKKDRKFLDYAGGYGVFTRIMRDIGFDYYWHDPYTDNKMAKGFEYSPNEKYHVASSLESFEHFSDPIAEIKKILLHADNLVFSTELVPANTPLIDEWWYYAPEHGQHISFYTKKSLRIIASKFSLHYYNLGNVHLFSKKKVGFLGQVLFGSKISKYIFYSSYFVLRFFVKSKTINDMYSMRKADTLSESVIENNAS